MSWTRSAKDKVTGLMTVVCYDYEGNEFFRGTFSDVNEANRAGEDAERRMKAKAEQPKTTENEFSNMSDDDLLSYLLD